MDMKRFFLYVSMIAALALAGCGGNGGGTPPVPGGPGPGVPGTTTGPTTAELFAMAQDLEDNSMTYAMGTTDAVKAAVDNSMKLDALSVAGDSSVAEANAQSVLDAKTTADESVGHIMTALDDATAALANDVDADDPLADTLTSALEQAIMVAEEQLEAAKMAAEGTDLKAAVEAVQGADPEAEGYPTTPTMVGAEVAMDVGGALMAKSPTDGERMRGTLGNAVPTAEMDPMETAVKMDNHQGRTWEEIVGSANVMEMRIAATGEGTTAVKAASFAGMPAASITTSTPAMTEEGVSNGTEFEAANYKGIDGTAFCAGSDCNVDEDGDLTGSWYFTPDVEDTGYMGTTTEGVTTYSAETLFVRFGHWLSVNTDDPTLFDINTYAMSAGNTGTLALNVDTDEGATTLTDTSATYNGMAAGMSLHKMVDADAKIVPGTLQSGAFTADVTLTATFGAAPTLGGTVWNFQSENEGAVDSEWSVNLLQRGFTTASFTEGTTVVTGGQPGKWSAQAYGNASERPEGILGGFNAHFSDGHAAGAYATRK